MNNKFLLYIELLNYLYNHQRLISADTLAENFQLSKRSIRRLISELREIGYEIESVSGPYGGYKLLKSNLIIPIRLTSAEKKIFAEIKNFILASDIVNKELATTLLNNIGLVSQLDYHIDTNVFFSQSLLQSIKNKVEANYNQLVIAINNKQRVDLIYESYQSTNLNYREFKPHQFQIFNDILYVKGYFSENNAFRILRLSRIKALKLSHKKYSFDENYDFDNKQAFSSAIYQNYQVKLKIYKGHHDFLEYKYGENQTQIEYFDHVILSFEMAGNLLIEQLVLSMGEYCEILEPTSIRESVIKKINKMQKNYIEDSM